MISCPTVRKPAIRTHYDLATLFYRLLWGEHIHHGLWEADESPDLAQRRLIERQADAAGIGPGMRVLDVGCGMGGTARHLARERRCDVTGITLSPVQQLWAATAARWAGLGRLTRFRCADAETVAFPPGVFDVVWSVECTEHLFDKPAFFRRAAGWLRPGGRVALCAWLAGPEPLTAEQRRLVERVCDGMLCPSLGTADDHRRWLADAGVPVTHFADVTERVDRTWEICLERTNRPWLQWLGRRAGVEMTRFLEDFDAILRAYRTGAMRYGCFIARKDAHGCTSSSGPASAW